MYVHTSCRRVRKSRHAIFLLMSLGASSSVSRRSQLHPPLSRFKEAFEEEEHESSTSDSEAEELDSKPAVKRKKPAQQHPSLEDLQEAGFRAGPSVLTVPEPQGDPNWDWCA